MSSSKIALAVKLRWRLRINLCVDKKKRHIQSNAGRIKYMKAFLETICHCTSSVNVSVRVNSLEINKPEKTKTFRDATFGLPAKPVTFEERLQKFQTDDAYF